MKPMHVATQSLFTKRYAYLVFAIIILIVSWEFNLSNKVLADAGIPEESIRLRILAHSDSPRDQWIKLKIRDEIVAHMREWVQEPDDINDARIEVQRHLPAFEQLVGQILERYGFSYTYSVELATVDFPTKIYGTKRYPAGDYEALRVVIGEGKGENWWCVLFPPLCFIDLTTSVTIHEKPNPSTNQNKPVTAKPATDSSKPADELEVRFYLWDTVKKAGKFLKGLFS